MKRAVKLCFMAAAALLIPGLILCAVGSVAGGLWGEALSRNNLISSGSPGWGWNWRWDWDRIGEGAVVEPQPIPADSTEIRRLDFTVQAGHLELTLGDDFSLNTDGCRGIRVDSSQEGGVWKLEVRADHDHVFSHGDDDTVEVVLPRDAWYEAVELECSAGAITGEDLACGNLEVDAQAGSVQLRRARTDSMELNADAGSVDVSGTVTDRVKMEVNAGSVTLRTPKPEQYGYALECNMGSVELFGEFSTAVYNRNKVNEDSRPFFDLEVNTGKAIVREETAL